MGKDVNKILTHLESLGLVHKQEYKLIETQIDITMVCSEIEELFEPYGCQSAIMFYRNETGIMYHGAGPNLPEEWIEAVNEKPINEFVCTVGSAIVNKRTDITLDVKEDKRWRELRDLVLKYHVRGLIYIPFLRANGVVMGTVGVFFPNPIDVKDKEIFLMIEILRHKVCTLQNKLHCLYNSFFDTKVEMCFGIVDEQKVFRYISDRVEKVLGISPNDLINKQMYIIVHPDDHPNVYNIYNSIVLAKKQVAKGIHRFQHADGQWITMEVRYEPQFRKSGESQGVKVIGYTNTAACKEFEQNLEG